MAQPRTYTQTTTFTDHSTVAPNDPHSGSDLDVEFVELKQTLDDLNTNIALIQRDDGKLNNQSVHKDSFDQDALALVGASGSGFTPRGDWAATTAYVAGDLVTNNAASYLTVTAHTSGASFAGDLSTYWTLIANSAIETSAASINMHNGTGSKTQFTTTYTYAAVGDIQVFVNGVLQATNLYSITNSGGNNITFVTAPTSGTNNVIIWGATVVAEAAKQGALTYRDTANNHKTTAERWSGKVDGSVVDAETSANSNEYSSKAYAIGGTGVTTTSGRGAAKEWAIGTGRIDDQSSGGYSAKEHATGTTVAEGSAKEWATNAGSAEVATGAGYSSKAYAQDTGNDIGSSRDWAVLATQVSSTDYSSKQYAVGTPPDGSAKEWATTTGAPVDTTYSSKEYAQGSVLAAGGSAKNWSQLATTPTTTATDASAKEWATGTSTHKGDGSAKSWATITGAVVAGSEYSAKEYAIGTTVAAGSAKDWALLAEDSVVDGGSGYSALHHAAKSSAYATASATSAYAAATSAANAASSYDSFDDRYLGVKTSDPTQDNDSNALVNGALYFNSTTNGMKVYDGANWINATSASTVSLLEYKFVTTSGQVSSKTYSGTADIGGSLSYAVNNTLVYLNGVLLKETVPSGATHDYVAQDGTSIVLTNAAVADDEITVVAFKSFTVSDTVSSGSGGTFSGAVTFGAGLTANGGIETSTTKKVHSKGNCVQTSFHSSLIFGS